VLPSFSGKENELDVSFRRAPPFREVFFFYDKYNYRGVNKI
jgi:hypothetical protein